MTAAVEKLPSSITVKVNGLFQEIFMSFALLNTLTTIIGDVENVFLIQMNPDIRESVMKQMLAERTKGGKVTKAVELEDCEISLEDVQFLLDFASAHIMDFLLGAVEKATALGAMNTERMQALASTLTGLANSPSKNSAA